MNNIQDIGNGYGFIYAVKPDGTTILFTEANTPDGVRNIKDRAVSASPLSATRNATGKITFTSVASAGSITSITVGGIQIIGAPIPCTTNDPIAYAAIVAQAINSFTSVPDWTAQAIQGVVLIISPLNNPDTLNAQAIVVTASAPSIISTTQATTGGIVNDTEYDRLIGLRYMLNADYNSSYVTNTIPATQSALGNYIEISKQVISRGDNVGVNTQRVSIQDDTIVNTNRIAINTTYVVDTQGGAPSDYLVAINPEGFVEGDEVYIQGKQASHVVTVVSIANAAAVSPIVQPNIKLQADTDFVSAGADTGLRLKYVFSADLNRYIFTEVARAIQTSNLQAADCAFVPPAPYVRGINIIPGVGASKIKYHMLYEKTNYVDNTYGNNTTAKTGSQECCFQTIEAAYSDAIANGVTRIYISGGTHTVATACLGSGITYICEPDTTIEGQLLFVSYSLCNFVGFPKIEHTGVLTNVFIESRIFHVKQLINNGTVNIAGDAGLFGYGSEICIPYTIITNGALNITAIFPVCVLGAVSINGGGAPTLPRFNLSYCKIAFLTITGYNNIDATEKHIANIAEADIGEAWLINCNGGFRMDGTRIIGLTYQNSNNIIQLSNLTSTIQQIRSTDPENIAAPTTTLINLDGTTSDRITLLKIYELLTYNNVKLLDSLTNGPYNVYADYDIDIGRWIYGGNNNNSVVMNTVTFYDSGVLDAQGRLRLKAKINCLKGGMRFEFSSNNGLFGATNTVDYNEFKELVTDIDYRSAYCDGDFIKTKNIERVVHTGSVIIDANGGANYKTANNVFVTTPQKTTHFQDLISKTAHANSMIFDNAVASIYTMKTTTMVSATNCIVGNTASIVILDNACAANTAPATLTNLANPTTNILVNAAINVY